MARLVRAKRVGERAFAADAGKKAIQDYLERVAKYVPAEILAAYLTALPIISGTTDSGSKTRKTYFAILLIGCAILTPFYLNFMAESDQPKRTHLIVGSFAYLIWVYSIGGFFTEIGWYQEPAAALLLIFFSLVSGLIVPTEGTQ